VGVGSNPTSDTTDTIFLYYTNIQHINRPWLRNNNCSTLVMVSLHASFFCSAISSYISCQSLHVTVPIDFSYIRLPSCGLSIVTFALWTHRLATILHFTDRRWHADRRNTVPIARLRSAKNERPTVNQMVIWAMTSRDLRGQTRDPNTLGLERNISKTAGDAI